jgi:hypothetical protein
VALIPAHVVPDLVIEQVLDVEAAKIGPVKIEVPEACPLNELGLESLVDADGPGRRAEAADAELEITAPRVKDDQPHAAAANELGQVLGSGRLRPSGTPEPEVGQAVDVSGGERRQRLKALGAVERKEVVARGVVLDQDGRGLPRSRSLERVSPAEDLVGDLWRGATAVDVAELPALLPCGLLAREHISSEREKVGDGGATQGHGVKARGGDVGASRARSERGSHDRRRVRSRQGEAERNRVLDAHWPADEA